MNRIILTVLIVFAVRCVSPAMVPLEVKLGERANRTLKDEHLPGLAIGVVIDGRVVLAKGFGVTGLGEKQPVSTDALFTVHSLSDEFTAVAILSLLEQGKLGLDQPASCYLAGWSEGWKDVTIRHLLAHCSGLTDITNTTNPFAEAPLLFQPGSQTRFSNADYYALRRIEENLAGQPSSKNEEASLFHALGMEDTRFVTDQPQPPQLCSAVMTSLNDLLVWEQARHKAKLLKKSTLALMFQPSAGTLTEAMSFGLGEQVWKANNQKVATPASPKNFSNAAIYRVLDQNISVIVLATENSPAVQSLAEFIATLYAPLVAPHLQNLAQPEPYPIIVPAKTLTYSAAL